MAESPTMEVRARLSADSAQFVRGMDEAVKSANNFSSVASGLNKSLFAVGIASSTAAIALIAFGVKSFRAAAEVEELDIALQAIGASSRYGYTELQLAVKAITAVGITATAAQRSVIRLAQSNVDLTSASELATVAQNLSVTASVSSAEALQTLAFAITTTQTRQLRSLGITTQASEAYSMYARTIGKAAKDLTMSEKRQAVLNLILKEGAKVTGAYALAIQSPSKALKEMADLTKNLQIAVGQRLLKAFSQVILSAFALYLKFTQAAQGTGVFAKALDAMGKVFTKLSDPFAKIATRLGDFIDKIDKSKISVNEIATAFEKALPAVAAFTTFVGVKTGKRLFQAIPIFQGFFEMLRPGVVAFLVLAATSTQVRDAFGRLVSSVGPLLGGFKNLGDAFSEVASVLTGVLAKAIDGVTAILTTTITFFKENRFALIALQATLIGVTAAFVAYKAIMIAQTISAKASSVVTRIQNVLFNAQAISAARLAVTNATLAAVQTTTALATAKATQQTAALNVATAMNNVVTLKQVAILGPKGAATKAVAAAEAQLAVASRALSTATAQVAVAQAGATTAATSLAAAQRGLAASSGAMLAPLLIKIAVIAAVGAAFIFLFKKVEGFREVVTKVFNAVASIIGKVFAFILRAFGNYLIAIGMLLDINNTFGQVVAAVFQFVYDTIIAVFLGIIKGIKFVLDAFINLMENNDTFRKVVIEVFNAVIRIIAMAVTFIVVAFANILKAIATGIFFFEKLLSVVKTIVKGIIAGIAILGKGIFSIFKTIGTGIGNFLADGLEKVKSWVQNLANLLSKIPKIGETIAAVISGITSVTQSAIDKIRQVGGNLSDALFGDTEEGSKKSVDLITGVSKTLIGAAKGWGNYSEGAAGAISNVANKMLDFTMKIVDFAAQDNGAKIVDGLVKGAKFASEGLGKVIAQVEKMQGFKIGEFIVKNTGEAAIKAGNFLLNLAASVESFTQGNVLGKLGDAFTDIMDTFKTGLGFGDILEEEKKRAKEVKGINGQDDETLNELQNSADLMKKIREAMADGIKSMRDVLEDLQSAAKDFADSLKDTILNFAGLKSVELPDGFIPKAKSLIENMRMRLDKSQQFATQIATLQGMGLDTKALQDIIESGPIKGAQLAASILGGGVEAIAQINEIQKKISFTGAAIGKFGSEAAFGAKIAATQLGIAQVSDAEAQISGVRGNNIVIEQGAFVVNVDTTGAESQEEKADIITKRITETFAILAKELANK